MLQSGWSDNSEKAFAGVLASSDLSAFLRPFAKDRLPEVSPGATPEETHRLQFLSDLKVTRRAMLTAFGTVLAAARSWTRSAL